MKNKIIVAIMALIIIAGIIITCTYGLNFGLNYSKHKEVDIYIGQEFKNIDVYEIATQVLGNQTVAVQKVELYEDMVSISAKDITTEQLTELNVKINEKYGLENTLEEIVVTEVPNIRGRDLIKTYIIPVAVSFIIIVVYLAVYNAIYSRKGRETNTVKTMIKNITAIILVQLLYLSILAITRLEVNRLTIPISIVLYIITTLGIMLKLEKKYSRIENN